MFGYGVTMAAGWNSYLAAASPPDRRACRLVLADQRTDLVHDLVERGQQVVYRHHQTGQCNAEVGQLVNLVHREVPGSAGLRPREPLLKATFGGGFASQTRVTTLLCLA